MPVLPNGSLNTSSVGVGCAYLAADFTNRAATRLIHSAMDEGATHFDTAPVYGRGTSETVLGLALRGRRDRVTITTKAGIARPPANPAKMLVRSMVQPLLPLLRRAGGAIRQPATQGGATSTPVNFTPSFIRQSLDESLTLLGTDYIDAFLLHTAQPEHITAEVVATLQDLKQAGKARAVGLATDREAIAAIIRVWPGVFDIVQHDWSVLDSRLEPSPQFRIIHRALMRALIPLSLAIEQNPDFRSRLAAASGLDLADKKRLPGWLLGAAHAENDGGIVLVASRRNEYLQQNIRDIVDPNNRIASRALVAALASMHNKPAPEH